MNGEYINEVFATDNDLNVDNGALQAVFRLLCCFDVDGAEVWFFEHGTLDVEVIGDMYQAILSTSEAHSTGATYTPQNIAAYLVDEAIARAGTTKPRVFDPACGCGHLLLVALRRLVAMNARARPLSAADVAQTCIFGADIDPNAAMLARMLLDIETFDPTRGPVDFRRNIVVQDSLLTPWKKSDAWLARFSASRFPLARFDVIVSNPPYVRAVKGAATNNRERITATGQYACLRGKWDTWLPFVELCWVLAKQHRAVAAIVVSDAIAYVPYARRLRDALHESGDLVWVSHFGERYDGWAMHACCFIIDGRGAPLPQRRVHTGTSPSDRCHSALTMKPLLRPDAERLSESRARYRGLTVGDVAYVSKGIELHSDQKHRAHSIAFTKRELLSDTRDAKHPIAFIESEQVGRGRRQNTRHAYVEYGSAKRLRAPRYVNRPTFFALHKGPRLLLSKSVDAPGVMFIAATAIVCQNTVVVKRWRDLPTVESSMRRKAKLSQCSQVGTFSARGEPADLDIMRGLSELCSYDFLCGIFLSSTFAQWIRSDRRAMYNVTPEVIASMPLPLVPRAPTPAGRAFAKVYARIETLVQTLRAGDFAKLPQNQARLDALVERVYRPWRDGTDLEACSVQSIIERLSITKAGPAQTRARRRRAAGSCDRRRHSVNAPLPQEAPHGFDEGVFTSPLPPF